MFNTPCGPTEDVLDFDHDNLVLWLHVILRPVNDV